MPAPQAITPVNRHRSSSPYSPAIRAGDFIFVSGCVAVDPKGEIAGGSVAEQTRVIIQNIARVLEAAGADLASVVRTTVYMVDIARFGEMNVAYRAAFKDPLPARSTVEISRLARPSFLLEIDAVAYVGD